MNYIDDDPHYGCSIVMFLLIKREKRNKQLEFLDPCTVMPSQSKGHVVFEDKFGQ